MREPLTMRTGTHSARGSGGQDQMNPPRKKLGILLFPAWASLFSPHYSEPFSRAPWAMQTVKKAFSPGCCGIPLLLPKDSKH